MVNEGWKMKILVRNLDRSVTEAEVLELFKAYGKVESCVVVTDKDTGKSRALALSKCQIRVKPLKQSKD